MAVPGSGNSLSLWGISKELTHDTDGYNNSIPLSTYQQYFFGSMSLHDMETQGSTYGHSVYDVINSASTSKPDGSNPNEMSEWYSYDHQAVSECLDKTGNTYSISSEPSGCSISTAFSGGVSVNQYNTSGYARFDAKVTGIFTTRIYRSSSSSYLRVRVFRSNGQVTGSGDSTIGMVLEENTANQSGYQTISFPVSANDEILILAQYTGGGSFFSTNFDRTFINDMSACQYTSYTEAKLFGPDSGTPSSSYYSTSASTIIGAAGYSYNSSSAWSTVYIHHCTSTNPIETGNTVYQTSNLTYKIGWPSTAVWRAITTDTSFPLSGIKAIYNGFNNSTSNIDDTSGDTN